MFEYVPLPHDMFWEEIPFSFADRKKLEDFLRDQAARGLMLTGMKNHRFLFREENSGTDCHFSIDFYHQKLTRARQKSPDFQEYLDTCAACGWHYLFSYRNAVFFRSEGELLPPPIQSDEALDRELEKAFALACEGSRMLSKYFFHVILLISLTILLFLEMRQRTVSLPFFACLGIVYGSYVIALVPELCYFIRFSRALGRSLPLPKSRRFWNVQDIQLFLLAIPTLYLLFKSWLYRFTSCFYWLLILTAVIALLLGFQLRNRRQNRYVRNTEGISFLLCLIMTGSILSCSGQLPTASDIRYMPGAPLFGSTPYWRDIPLSPEAEALKKSLPRLFLTYSDLEYGSEPDATVIREPDCTNRWCEREFFHTEQQEFHRSHVGQPDGLHYVGTVAAWLSSPGDLSPYLRMKSLSLEDADPVPILEGVDSYRMKSGKEWVHVKGNALVIYYLNPEDIYTFPNDSDSFCRTMAKKLETLP